MLSEMDDALTVEFLMRAPCSTRDVLTVQRAAVNEGDMERIVEILKMSFPVGLHALVDLSPGTDQRLGRIGFAGLGQVAEPFQ